jgi:hypothetical protein
VNTERKSQDSSAEAVAFKPINSFTLLSGKYKTLFEGISTYFYNFSHRVKTDPVANEQEYQQEHAGAVRSRAIKAIFIALSPFGYSSAQYIEVNPEHISGSVSTEAVAVTEFAGQSYLASQ